MDNKRPLLLLDVDGPLNPWAAKPSRRPEGYTTHRLRPRGWEDSRKPLRVWLSPGHGPLLLDFAGSYGVELVWATTWQHDANKLIGPVIGLPELPVIDFGRHPGTARGWKFPAVADFAEDRPLAWLDDDFSRTRGFQDLSMFQSRRSGIPTLLHHVDPKIGMTAADLSAVAEWLQREVCVS